MFYVGSHKWSLSRAALCQGFGRQKYPFNPQPRSPGVRMKTRHDIEGWLQAARAPFSVAGARLRGSPKDSHREPSIAWSRQGFAT